MHGEIIDAEFTEVATPEPPTPPVSYRYLFWACAILFVVGYVVGWSVHP